MTLWWATSEAAIGNSKESAALMQLARQTVAASLVPSAIRLPLIRMTDAAANQTTQANAGGGFYDQSRLVGTWRILDPSDGNSSFTVLLSQSSPLLVFYKDQFEAGVLSSRISGTVVISDVNEMRLDGNLALAMTSSGPVQIPVGYSSVKLRRDGTLTAIDYPLGLPPRRWAAKRTK